MSKYIWYDGEWVPIERFKKPETVDAPAVIGQIKEFVSPVDGSVIDGRTKLRDHNKKHGVVDRREFIGHKFEREPLPPAAPDVAHAYKQATGKL